jgi:hypothetical protein
MWWTRQWSVRRLRRQCARRIGLVGVLVMAASGLASATACAAALTPGEIVVTDSEAFGGCDNGGCGGEIAVNPATGGESVLSSNATATVSAGSYLTTPGQPFGAPFTIAWAPNGGLYVGDTFGLGGSCSGGCGGILELDPGTGAVSVVSSNAQPINVLGNSEYFNQVNGVAVAANGEIIVEDWGGCSGCGKIISVDPSNGQQTLISPKQGQTQLMGYPQGLALDGNDAFVADANGHGGACGSGATAGCGGIIEVNLTTGVQTLLSSDTTPVSSDVYVNGVENIAVDAGGMLLVSDAGGGDILQVDPSTGAAAVFASNAGQANASTRYFSAPIGISIAPDGTVVVADPGAFLSNCGGSYCPGGAIIEVNPLTRQETLISDNPMQASSADQLFAYPWGVLVVPPPGADGSGGTAGGSGGSGGPGTGGSGGTSGGAGSAGAGNGSVNGTSASVSVSCTGSSGATCDVTVSLTANETVKGGKVVAVSAKARKPKTTKPTVTLGTESAMIDAGDSQTITVSLNRTGLKLLKRHHKLPGKLGVSSGGSTISSQTVTFKEPTKGKH